MTFFLPQLPASGQIDAFPVLYPVLPLVFIALLCIEITFSIPVHARQHRMY